MAIRRSGAESPRIRFRPVLRYRWRRSKMLETIAIILVILWLAGLVTSHTMGGLVHILLVIAVVVILVRVIRGKKPLR